MDPFSPPSLPADRAADPVEMSWARCRKGGLPHSQRPGFATLDAHTLANRQTTSAGLIEATSNEILPCLDNMLQNTDCRVVLAGHDGVILQIWQSGARAEPALDGLRPGHVWDEASAGTNAIGTCLTSAQALHIRTDQHYLRTHHRLAGSAAPVCDARGNLAGTLALFTTTRVPGDYTLGMAKLLSHGIENRLIFRTYQGEAHILKFNTSATGLDSSWAGLLVAGADGDILTANRRARTMLGEPLTGMALTRLFGQGVADLLAVATRGPTRIQARGNYQIFAQLQPPRIPDARPAKDNAGTTEALTATQSSVHIPDDVIAPDSLEHGDNRVSRLVKQCRKIMEKDIPILVFGETGSGKEILVRSLHYHSRRASGPMVAVNCAAIPAELAESQLFGYEKGAFTGAHNKGYIGLIRQADGGTLFLDEIGEMPLTLQSRLLRVLQERVVTPLGSVESYPVDVKLISATNRSLREDIARGRFRQDLYYRIAGLNVELPSLRERQDIEALISFVHRRLLQAEPGPPLSADMLGLLVRHRWPGNIRQLVHVLKVGLAMADGECLEAEHLPDDFFADTNDVIGVSPEPLSERLPRLYRANNGNVARTARAAGVSRNTVYKYLRPVQQD